MKDDQLFSPTAASSTKKSSSSSTKKRKLDAKGEIEEKRLTNLRRGNEATRQRTRARQQRLYLVQQKDNSREGLLSRQFSVLGSTGNVYEVTIAQRPTCNCPDSLKGNICKHVLFVYLKVLRVPPTSHILFQTSLLQKELEECFARCPQEDSLRCVLANEATRKAFRIQSGQEEVEEGKDVKAPEMRDIDTECPVCFEDINKESKEALVFCGTCKRPTHKDCFSRWKMTKLQSHEPVTCVYCRSQWVDVIPGKTAGVHVDDGGYVNLASLQGIDTTRDTSTYSEWYGRRRL